MYYDQDVHLIREQGITLLWVLANLEIFINETIFSVIYSLKSLLNEKPDKGWGLATQSHINAKRLSRGAGYADISTEGATFGFPRFM